MPTTVGIVLVAPFECRLETPAPKFMRAEGWCLFRWFWVVECEVVSVAGEALCCARALVPIIQTRTRER